MSGTEFTHAVVVYDAADNHGIERDYGGGDIVGCRCGFQCPEWDTDGDTLVTHLRALDPRPVIHIHMTGPKP